VLLLFLRPARKPAAPAPASSDDAATTSQTVAS
jgi:hypothetical protein